MGRCCGPDARRPATGSASGSSTRNHCRIPGEEPSDAPALKGVSTTMHRTPLSRLQAALRTLLKRGFHGLFVPPLGWMSDSSARLLYQLGKDINSRHQQYRVIPITGGHFYSLAIIAILMQYLSFIADNSVERPRFSRLQPARPAPKCAHVQKAQRRTTVRRTGVSKPNLVAAAVRLAGGPGAAATICGVSRQTIYDWINERRVERLIERAQTLSRLWRGDRKPGRGRC